jgi:hypothetical protein
MEHLSTSWPSPYLRNVVAIHERVCLPFVPPTLRYLGSHLLQWSLLETNHLIAGHHLPYVGSLTKYSRQPMCVEHPQLATIDQFRLSNIYIYIFISKSAIHYIITVDHKSWITWAPFKGLFFIFFLCLYLDLITLIVLTCLCMLLWNRSS